MSHVRSVTSSVKINNTKQGQHDLKQGQHDPDRASMSPRGNKRSMTPNRMLHFLKQVDLESPLDSCCHGNGSLLHIYIYIYIYKGGRVDLGMVLLM